MITPAGKECRYYYQDYFRGRERQECRLIAQNPRSEPWRPEVCKACPVPGILRANACPNMVMEARVDKTMLGLRRRVVVEAVCTRYIESGFDPHVGCGHCHEERAGAALFELEERP
ncbi:MAG: hypothetical protein JXA93_14705 [Anaerolineae bacterium]|nr:hypothetical protein [Anaerolineae bacterium]